MMLRNPVDMMYSLHSHCIYNGTEDILDFESALKAEPRREMAKAAGTAMFLKENLLYREAASSFESHVRRYFATFDKNSIMVILFDDLKAATESVYNATCAFLDIDSSVSVDFSAENKNKPMTKPRIPKFLMRPPRIAKMVASVIPRTIRKHLLAGMYRHTMKYEP